MVMSLGESCDIYNLYILLLIVVVFMPSIVYYYHTMCIYVFAMSYCIYCIIYYYDKTDDISNDLWVSETGVPGTPNTTPKSPHFF